MSTLIPPVPGLQANLLATTPSIGLLIPMVGPATGGTPVLIIGSGLANATSVTFGGTPATVLFQDPLGLLIIALAPAHAAGPVQVVVTTTSGTSAPALFTYLTPAPPIAALITPNTGPAAGGTPFTITGVNLTGAAVTFGGIAATGVTVDTTGTILTGVTPAHAA
ncbi:hypothetical protein GCM10020000_08970 [Streptomyces olivoverticillatus]